MNIYVAILILKMERKKQHFWYPKMNTHSKIAIKKKKKKPYLIAERVTAESATKRAAAVCNKAGFATKVWDFQCVISRPVTKVSPGNLLKGDSSISPSLGGAFCPDPKVGATSRRQPWDSTLGLRPSGQYTGLCTQSNKKKKSNIFGILCFIISRKVKTQLKYKKYLYNVWRVKKLT